jgi:hypothetical protein
VCVRSDRRSLPPGLGGRSVVPSLPEVASTLPSGLKLLLTTSPASAAQAGPRAAPVRGSHSRTLPSWVAVARVLPSGENASAMEPGPPVVASSYSREPSGTRVRTTLLPTSEAVVRPSGLKATAVTENPPGSSGRLIRARRARSQSLVRPPGLLRGMHSKLTGLSYHACYGPDQNWVRTAACRGPALNRGTAAGWRAAAGRWRRW